MLPLAGDGGAGQLRFSLFGVPVAIDPTFLILLVIVALPLATHGAGYAVGIAVLVFASVLGHELGHAVAVQALVEPEPSILLYGLGGVTSHHRSPSRPRSLAVSLAGPAAGLLVGAVALVAGRAAGGQAADLGELGWELSLFWTVANLLPVLPLDGGHALEHALPGGEVARHRTVLIVSIVTCAVGLALAWSWGEPFLLAFAAWFGLTNLLELRTSRRHAASAAGITGALESLHRDFGELRPADAAALEDEARRALSQTPAEHRAFVGSVLVAALLVQDRHDEASDLVSGLGPDGCAHALAQLAELGRDGGAVLEDRLRSRSSSYDASLLLLDRALHHDWARASSLVEERPPETFEPGWLELATSWAFHAGAFHAASTLGRVLEARVNSPAASYNVACASARAGDVTGGLAAMERAVERGWNDLAQLDHDDDLAALRSRPEWDRIRRSVRGAGPPTRPTSRRFGAALGLVATLAVTAMSIRLAGADDPPLEPFGGASAANIELVARDARTGRERWRRSDAGMAPTWVDDELVLASTDGGVRALDVASGADLWTVDAADGLPTVGTDVVVISTFGDERSTDAEAPAPRVTAVDRRGTHLWSRQEVTAVSVAGDTVVLSSAGGDEVVGADASTGETRWSLSGAMVPGSLDDAGTLVLQDAERVVAIDPASGARRWSALGEAVGTTTEAAWVRRAGERSLLRLTLEGGTASVVEGVSPSAFVEGEDDGVVVLSDGSRRWAVAGTEVLWESEAGGDEVAIAAVGGGSLVEALGDDVVAWDLRTGAPRWRTPVTDPYFVEARSGVVLVFGVDGTLVLDASSGSELWSVTDPYVEMSERGDVVISASFGP